MAGGLFNWPATAAVTALLAGVRRAVGPLDAQDPVRPAVGHRAAPAWSSSFSAITMPATVWWAVGPQPDPPADRADLRRRLLGPAERTGRTRWAVLTLRVRRARPGCRHPRPDDPAVLAVISLGWFETAARSSRGWSRSSVAAGASPSLAWRPVPGHRSPTTPPTSRSSGLDTDWGLLGPLTSTMLGHGVRHRDPRRPWDWLSPLRAGRLRRPAAVAHPPVVGRHRRRRWRTPSSPVAVPAAPGRCCCSASSSCCSCSGPAGRRTSAPIAGTEYRYLTEAAALAMLALGLAYLEVDGRPDSSVPRETPAVHAAGFPVRCRSRWPPSSPSPASGRTTQFAHIWHGLHRAARLRRRARARARGDRTGRARRHGPARRRSSSPIIWSEDRLPRMVGLLSPKSTFPDAAHDLAVDRRLRAR